MISIIIPTYFEEKYIESCLKSIIKNSPKNIEIIVVDSNSSDKTREIAGKYADKVINIKNRGVGKARNIGAEVAKGEILLFVDADTILSKTFIREFEKTFHDSKVVCSAGFVFGDNKNLGIFLNIYKYLWFCVNNLIALISSIFGFPLFPTVCCGCRRWAFDAIGGFNEELAVGEDIDFSMRMGKLGKCRLSRKAVAFTSTRRIEKYGASKNLWLFFGNYLKIYLFNKRPWVNRFPHVD